VSIDKSYEWSLQDYHSQTVRQLEQVLTTYLKSGKTPDPNKRPTLKTGSFLGMGGQKHDAIEFLTAKVQRLENKIEAVRDNIDARKVNTFLPFVERFGRDVLDSLNSTALLVFPKSHTRLS